MHRQLLLVRRQIFLGLLQFQRELRRSIALASL
jgi:hypothetical protein